MDGFEIALESIHYVDHRRTFSLLNGGCLLALLFLLDQALNILAVSIFELLGVKRGGEMGDQALG